MSDPSATVGHDTALARRTYAVTLVVFVLLPTLLSLRWPPNLGHDAQFLSLSWNHFARTGEVSRLPELDSANLAHDVSTPLIWWSPGPALAVGAVTLAGLSWGQALSLWVGLTGWLQLAGWRRLYRALGFSPLVIALSLLAMAASWHTLYSYRRFLGGDVFAAAVLPWGTLLLVQLAERRKPGWMATSFFFTVLVGVFFKLSFFVSAAGVALGATLAARHEKTARPGRPWLARGSLLALGLGSAWLITYFLFLRHGASPADRTSIEFSAEEMFRRAALPVVLPFSSLLAFTSLGGRVCDWLGWAHLSANTALTAAALGLALWAHVRIWRASSSVPRAMIAGMCLVCAVAFAGLYLRGAAVSFEDRLFAPCGWFLLPALISLFATARHRVLSWTGGSLLALTIIWGVASYALRAREIARERNTSHRGYTLATLPREVECALVRIAPGAESAILVLSPEIEALLARPQDRVAILAANPASVRGRTPGYCVVVLPPPVDALTYLARFQDYPAGAWTIERIEGWSICVAVNSTSPSNRS